MQLVGARGQQVRDVQYSVSRTTTSSATVMLVLPEQQMRSSFIFQNLSANAMYLEIGAGEATATISGGAVTGVTLVNSGTNYTIAPQVLLLGGGNAKRVKELPPGARRGHNLTAFRGGFRLWSIDDVPTLAADAEQLQVPRPVNEWRMI